MVQREAADVLLDGRTIASIIPILPSIAKPLGMLLDPFIQALPNTTAPYDLTPLLQPVVQILMETTDDEMLSEILDVLRVLLVHITPPLSIQRDLYRKFKEISNLSLQGQTKANALGFQASLIDRLGLEILITPPIPDPTAKDFTLSMILEACNDLDRDIVAEVDPETEAGNRMSFKLAVLSATIRFYLSDAAKPFTPQESKEIGCVITKAIEVISTFVQTEYDAQKPADSLFPTFSDPSDIVKEAVKCLTSWIIKGDVHGQNDKLLHHMMTIYVALYCGEGSDDVFQEAVKGITGLVKYTTDGPAEFMKWKELWVGALFNNVGILKKNVPMPESMSGIIHYMFQLMTIMVNHQPEVITKEEGIRDFPMEVYKCFDKDRWIDPNAGVKYDAAILAVRILLALTNENEDDGTKRSLIQWKTKLNDLLIRATDEAQVAELRSLILSLDQAVEYQ